MMDWFSGANQVLSTFLEAPRISHRTVVLFCVKYGWPIVAVLIVGEWCGWWALK